jgi:prophage regulatory protein
MIPIPFKPTRIVRLKEVIDRTGLSRSSIYRLAEHGFPKSVRIGITAVGWREADINRWIAEREISTTTIH